MLAVCDGFSLIIKAAGSSALVNAGAESNDGNKIVMERDEISLLQFSGMKSESTQTTSVLF